MHRVRLAAVKAIAHEKIRSVGVHCGRSSATYTDGPTQIGQADAYDQPAATTDRDDTSRRTLSDHVRAPKGGLGPASRCDAVRQCIIIAATIDLRDRDAT